MEPLAGRSKETRGRRRGVCGEDREGVAPVGGERRNGGKPSRTRRAVGKRRTVGETRFDGRAATLPFILNETRLLARREDGIF